MFRDKGMKVKVAEKGEEGSGSEQLDEQTVRLLRMVEEIDDQLEKIKKEASDKVLEVQQKYIAKCRPVYDQRSHTIASMPDFWFTAFSRHSGLRGLMTEEEEEIFKEYLNSLEVKDLKDEKLGYSITFNFKPNPFFEDTKLTKTFSLVNGGEVTKTTATSVKWKEDKRTKRPISGNGFFQWFEDKRRYIHRHNDENLQVARVIKDDLWPYPYMHFNHGTDEEDSDSSDNEVKKIQVAEKGEDGSCSGQQLDAETVLPITKLQEIEDELVKINKEARDEVFEVEQKYNEIQRPLHEKRSDSLTPILGSLSTAFFHHPWLCDALTEEDQEMMFP